MRGPKGETRIRLAVVGHVEWVTFAVVERLPVPGEIVEATSAWEDACGGGGIVAVQFARLNGSATLFTALGADLAARARERLNAHRVDVVATEPDVPMRRAFTQLDATAERTITVHGNPVEPRGADLPSLAGYDGVFFSAGDAAAAQAARAARVLVATPRAAPALREAGVELDFLVHSAGDPAEAATADGIRARERIVTRGAEGGSWSGGTWRAVPPPGEPVDAFGCGDTFVAGLTFGLARGDDLPTALELGARCGATCLTGRGPYGRMHPLPIPSTQ